MGLNFNNAYAPLNRFVVFVISTWPTPATPYNSIVFIEETQFSKYHSMFFVFILITQETRAYKLK